MSSPNFDLENEDIPALEPSGLFAFWVSICIGFIIGLIIFATSCLVSLGVALFIFVQFFP